MNPKRLEELCSVILVKNINKRNNLDHLKLPIKIKQHLYLIWKCHQMRGIEMSQRIQEIDRKLPLCCYCFYCTKELNLTFDKRISKYNLTSDGVRNIMGEHPYSFFGYCDNCMFPLYEINIDDNFCICDFD